MNKKFPGAKTLRKTKKIGVFPQTKKTMVPMEPENIGENNTKPAICPHGLSLHNLMVAPILPYYASFEWGEEMTGFQEQTLFFALSLFPLFTCGRRPEVKQATRLVVF